MFSLSVVGGSATLPLPKHFHYTAVAEAFALTAFPMGRLSGGVASDVQERRALCAECQHDKDLLSITDTSESVLCILDRYTFHCCLS